MKLSKKQKTFSELFGQFLKSTSNFEHFAKEDETLRLCMPEINDCERRG